MALVQALAQAGASSATGGAATASTTAVPPHIAAALPGARLSGRGSYRWFGIRVYDATLWVGPQGLAGIDGYALELRYARAFDGRKIAERSLQEIERLGWGSDAQHQAWLTRMAACFPDVEDGTRLTGQLLPTGGIRYYRDGKPICDIDDHEFASAFFAIWLDPHTSAPALRSALLGMSQ